MKIYVAGPYGRRNGLTEPECKHNVDKAIDVARALILRGHIPLVPHLYHYVHVGWEETLNEDGWWGVCASWLEDCDALYLLPGWDQSIGTLRELQTWMKIHECRPSVPIIYTSVQQVPSACSKVY